MIPVTSIETIHCEGKASLGRVLGTDHAGGQVVEPYGQHVILDQMDGASDICPVINIPMGERTPADFIAACYETHCRRARINTGY